MRGKLIIEFMSRKLDGVLDTALGSDGTMIPDQRLNHDSLHDLAIKQARRLKAVQPGYVAYRFARYGDNLNQPLAVHGPYDLPA